MKLRTLFYAIPVIFFSCNQEKSEVKETTTVKIPLIESSNKNELDKFLSGIEFSFTPLETTSQTIFGGGSKVYVTTNNDILICDKRGSKILRYDLNGNFLNNISVQGEGPEEYISIRDIALDDDKVYILDPVKILVYSLDGSFERKIQVNKRSNQIAVMSDKNILTTCLHTFDNQVTIYNQEGEILTEYMPPREILKLYPFGAYSTFNSTGNYKDATYFTTYFNNSIYCVKDSVEKIAEFDFGENNIPSEFFDCETKEQFDANFQTYRSKSSMGIDKLTLTDSWIIFTPQVTRDGGYSIYYNRDKDVSFSNIDFRFPYDKLLSWYPASNGYLAQKDQFYRLINVSDLKDVLEELSEQNDFADRYPSLSNISYKEIDEDDNDWVMFFKLKY